MKSLLLTVAVITTSADWLVQVAPPPNTSCIVTLYVPICSTLTVLVLPALATAEPLYNQLVVNVPPVEALGVAVNTEVCPGNKLVNDAVRLTVGNWRTVNVPVPDVVGAVQVVFDNCTRYI